MLPTEMKLDPGTGNMYICEKYSNDDEEQPSDEPQIAVMVESQRGGRKLLQYNGYTYRKAYKTKKGTRWSCSVNKNCNAFLYMNDDSEILSFNENHEYCQSSRVESVDTDQKDAAVVITSRKGKEMLLFRQYTYRKQYGKSKRSRWVCSTLKNCRACVFTDNDNVIISVFEEHCHNPPKYYLKPDHVLGALREPLLIDAD